MDSAIEAFSSVKPEKARRKLLSCVTSGCCCRRRFSSAAVGHSLRDLDATFHKACRLETGWCSCHHRLFRNHYAQFWEKTVRGLGKVADSCQSIWGPSTWSSRSPATLQTVTGAPAGRVRTENLNGSKQSGRIRKLQNLRFHGKVKGTEV